MWVPVDGQWYARDPLFHYIVEKLKLSEICYGGDYVEAVEESDFGYSVSKISLYFCKRVDIKNNGQQLRQSLDFEFAFTMLTFHQEWVTVDTFQG